MLRYSLIKIETCADSSGRLPRGISITAMRRAALGGIAAALCAIVVIAGCDRSPTADSSTRSYQVRGIVRGFAPDRSTVSIQHEDIPGVMPSMTMPFSVKDQKEIADLKIGEGVSFRMTMTDKDLFLDQVKTIAATDVRIKAPSPAATAAPRTADRLNE